MTSTSIVAQHVRRTSLAKRHPAVLMGSLGALAVLLSIYSLKVGATQVSFGNVLHALVGDKSDQAAAIVFDFQLPRVLLCWLIGTALAVSGAVMQGVIRNPLAAPDIVGVTKGAGFGGMLLLLAIPGVPVVAVVPAAFTGGLAAAALVYLLAYRRGATPVRIALVGIAVSAAFEAGIRFLLVRKPLDVSAALIWLTGSLFGRSMSAVLETLPWVLVLVPLIVVWARKLDVLGLGDDLAAGLGEPVEKTRRLLLLFAVALAAAAVAVAGTIGFVGLIAPHMARRVFGGKHLASIPAAALFGVLLMLFADMIGRGLAPPLEIPAGLVTAVVGGPYFLYLLVKTGK
ncbi:Fe(3+)-citrate ABC transporter permease YfmE [Kribbella jejuensis]|uniref:Iron complex transport system permease protein n=1 Tax=Kribbella jejuensis TaxID=236068 RepID=A0A542EQN2_9ACTN|nr:iron ABC transporter permease [Kribbella jejuensis]TQJ17672.1 iron complex transport system permease protein [Kribbella jejuensis]